MHENLNEKLRSVENELVHQKLKVIQENLKNSTTPTKLKHQVFIRNNPGSPVVGNSPNPYFGSQRMMY